MLDKSVKSISVLMVKDDPMVYPRFELPEGYRFAFYHDGMEEDWGVIEHAVGQVATVEEGVELFRKEFFPRKEFLYTHSLFVLDGEDRPIATCAVWYGDSFGIDQQRVHWVAVHPDHSGKGICKAMLTRLMDLYGELGYSDPLYLISSTWSWQAIGIYGRFGFVPHMGPKPANWSDDAFEDHAREAWDIIRGRQEAFRAARG